MSQPKSSQSGLRTVKRDFSDAKLPDEPISWPKKQVDAKEQRLKDIQAGIEQRGGAALLQSYTNLAAAHIGSSKRPLSGTTDEPLKRKRHFPPGWETDACMTSTDFTRNYSSSPLLSSESQSITVSTTLTTQPLPSHKSKITLSQEQTQIIRLVEEGKGLFYTGSAGTGKSVLLREIIKSLRKRHVKSPDAVAITASTGKYTPYMRIKPLSLSMFT
ncbi:hypothetical protein J3A83DRAFT_326607 [Scleroderma citrinum]